MKNSLFRSIWFIFIFSYFVEGWGRGGGVIRLQLTTTQTP